TDYRFGCGLFLPITDLTQRIWNLLPSDLYTPKDPGSRRYNKTESVALQWPQTAQNADKPPFMFPFDLTTAGLHSVEYSSYAGYNDNTFLNFSLPVDPNTAYRIDLGFEELWYYYTARLLDIYVDGELMVKELDLATVAGVGVPYTVTLKAVSRPSGFMNIFLNTSINSLHNNVFINTLELFRVIPTDLSNQAALLSAAKPLPPPAPFAAADTTAAPTSSDSSAALGIGIAVGMGISIVLLASLATVIILRTHYRNRQARIAAAAAAAEAGYYDGTASAKSKSGSGGADGGFGGAFSDSGILALISGKFGSSADDKHKAFKNLDAEATAKTGLFGARIFSLAELRRATDDFASGNLIGQGGFGKVYRATLGGSAGEGSDAAGSAPAVPGFEVAVKRLGSGSQQGASEFLTEVQLLSRLHHKNLVNLIGYCDEDPNQLILVYEYAPNGTLKDYLRDVVRVKSLSWERRLRIATTAAKGLEYLHNGASPSVIHRDIKTSNILLDYSFNAKVADFGLSKLGKKTPATMGMGVEEKTDKSHISTRVKGTLGYLDPMYYTKQHLTDKSDVFSFGVVLLELLTGRLPIWQEDDASGLQNGGESLINLVEWTEPFLKSGQIRPIVAPTLDVDRHMQSLMKVADLAYRCVRTQPKSRPPMAEVVRVLAEAKALLDAEGSSPPASSALPLPTPSAAAAAASVSAGAGAGNSLLESSLKVGDGESALLMDEAGDAFVAPHASVSAAAAAAAVGSGGAGDYANPFSISVISDPHGFAASDLHHLLFERILGEEGGGGGGGGGGGEAKKSDLYSYMVYSPSYYIATVTAIIVIVSLVFEKIIHVIHHWFGHRKNKALVHVVDRIKDELMVAGFLSIVLALINPLLAEWCVPVSRDTILIPCQPPDKAYYSPYNSYNTTPSPVPAAGGTAKYTDNGFPWVQLNHSGVTPIGENGTTFSTVVKTEQFPNGTGVEIRETTITFPNGTQMTTTANSVFVGNETGAVTNNTNLTTPDDESTNTPIHVHEGELFPHFDFPNDINDSHDERGLLETTSHKNGEASASAIENQIRRLILDWERQKDREQHSRHLLEGDDRWEHHGSSLIHHGRRKLASFANECPAGEEPLMSPAAIHQLHLFIFFLVAGHILYTCITIVIARAKVSTWHRWENKCQEKMRQRKGAVSGQLTRALQDRSFILRRTGPLSSFRRRVAADVADAGSSSAGAGYDVEQPPPSVEQDHELARTFQEVVKEGAEAKGKAQAREQEAREEAREPARRSTKLQVHYSDEDDEIIEEEPEHFTWIGEEEEEGDNLDTISEEEEEEREEEERKEGEGGGQGEGSQGGGGEGKKRLTRLSTMARREASTELTTWQSLVLTVSCFFQQLFNPITQSDYYTLRLAFIHNQNLPRNFDFYHHVVSSLEKDFVHIVGLSLPLWITLIIVICITSYKWDISLIFSVLGFLIALAVGTKLEYIVSVLALESAHVTGDCEGCHLKPRGSLFWFRRPSFMLSLLHFALFVSSYMIGNLVVYYYLALNQSQCKSYSAWVPWLKFILGIATILICSLSTLPLYALLTHMGGKPSQSSWGDGSVHKKLAAAFTEQVQKIKEHRSKQDIQA
ncbi:unnamed protein product, partial [Closterium sp. Yama58-4]